MERLVSQLADQYRRAMVRRLLDWLKEPVLPPKWLRRDSDPMDAVDWATFGRIVGGRIRVFDDPTPDSRAQRLWKEGGKRTPKALPRKDWILICVILAAEVGGFGFFIWFIHQHMH